jgi:hypothetical protein
VVRSTGGCSESYHEKQRRVIGSGEHRQPVVTSPLRWGLGQKHFLSAIRDLHLRVCTLSQTHVTKAEQGKENDLGN